MAEAGYPMVINTLDIGHLLHITKWSLMGVVQSDWAKMPVKLPKPRMGWISKTVLNIGEHQVFAVTGINGTQTSVGITLVWRVCGQHVHRLR